MASEVDQKNIQINVTSASEHDIVWDPIFLTYAIYDKKYIGRYGSIKQLLENEFNSNIDSYHKTVGKVEIQNFIVSVDDQCKKNLTSIDININVYKPKSDKPFFNYKKQEKVKSYVSDCSSIFYSATLLGLLWYVPHVGINGTREDQIEFLVNSNLENFFKELKNAK